MKRSLLLLATITLLGCARPGDHPISQNCAWLEPDSHSLDLTKRVDRQHLNFDAVTAEDMAIRWADVNIGHRSGYEPRRDECMETLFQGIAKQHNVDVAIVRQFSRERDLVLDAAVIFSVSILFLCVAYVFTGRIRWRFFDSDSGYWIMSLTMAAGVSLVGVLAGGLGSIVIEVARLNSGHLSYRMNRIPFRSNWAVMFVCGFVVFGLVALIRSRAKSQGPRPV